MQSERAEHQGFPFPPVLLAVDMLSLILMGLCLPEVFPEMLGKSPGVISPELAVPLLAVAIPLVLFCAFGMVRSALKGRPGTVGEWS